MSLLCGVELFGSVRHLKVELMSVVSQGLTDRAIALVLDDQVIGVPVVSL